MAHYKSVYKNDVDDDDDDDDDCEWNIGPFRISVAASNSSGTRIFRHIVRSVVFDHFVAFLQYRLVESMLATGVEADEGTVLCVACLERIGQCRLDLLAVNRVELGVVYAAKPLTAIRRNPCAARLHAVIVHAQLK